MLILPSLIILQISFLQRNGMDITADAIPFQSNSNNNIKPLFDLPFLNKKRHEYDLQQQQQQQHHHYHPLVKHSHHTSKVLNLLRGGDDDSSSVIEEESTIIASSDNSNDNNEEEDNLEDRVYAAMRKLGISVDENEQDNNTNDNMECKDGVCALPSSSTTSSTSSTTKEEKRTNTEDIQTMTKRISKELNVDEQIVFAAIGATLTHNKNSENEDDDVIYNEDAAREMIQNELNAIQRVMEDCDEVKQLVSEGHDLTLSRRALAFADMNIEVARAILIADEEDAKVEQKQAEERQAAAKKESEEEMKTVTVDANFDPTKLTTASSSSSTAAAVPPVPTTTTTTTRSATSQPPQGAPKPAKKENVVFQATSSNIQQLVLESPVPVLLDVYADWCGPCKALTPALEDMAVKAGGMFRLVKLNTDEERNLSSALEVTSLPTVFGIKDGKILHSFQGMPRSEDFMKNFMMGLFGASDFNPKVTADQKKKYDELSNKLIKVAGAAGFSFSQRERLQVRTNSKLDELVKVRGDNMADAEETAKILRSLMSNVIRDPFDLKFRRVNLENKIIASKIGAFPPAISILKSVGFANDEGSPRSALILGKGKKIVNVAPFVVARDAIDKWIDLNRRAIATAARKKQDELARAKLLEEAALVEEDEYDYEDEEEDEIDVNVCNLKIRLEGKKKIHDVQLHADDPISSVIDALPKLSSSTDDEIQITCAAKRLILKSSDENAMKKTLGDYKLLPAASIVVRVVKQKTDDAEEESKTTSIKERAAARRKKSKGEHTMQSVGIYAKDDNAKGELIDGGGGVWYEHDVSDDEEEKENDSKGEEEEDDKEDEETKDE